MYDCQTVTGAALKQLRNDILAGVQKAQDNLVCQMVYQVWVLCARAVCVLRACCVRMLCVRVCVCAPPMKTTKTHQHHHHHHHHHHQRQRQRQTERNFQKMQELLQQDNIARFQKGTANLQAQLMKQVEPGLCVWGVCVLCVWGGGQARKQAGRRSRRRSTHYSCFLTAHTRTQNTTHTQISSDNCNVFRECFARASLLCFAATVAMHTI